MSRKIPVSVLLSFLAVFLSSCPFALPANAAPSVESILDGRTSFRWGKDFLVWVVNYPEDIVDPWVEANAGVKGDPNGEMAADFRKSLRIGNATPVLLSIHSYTDRAMELKPLSERFFLMTGKGEKIAPQSYDSVFDGPVAGLVQGLVFFPVVEGPFELVLDPDRGGELAFEFPDDRDNRIRRETAQKVENRMDAASDAETQKMQYKIREVSASLAEGREEWEQEKADLEKQIKALSSQKDILRRRLDETLAKMSKPAVPARPEVPKEGGIDLSDITDGGKKDEGVSMPPGFSRTQICSLFLVSWKEGDLQGMFSFLSPSLRSEVSDAEGLKNLLRRKALPAKMPLDAKLRDDGKSGEADVVFAQKLLVVRTLRSAELKLSELGGGWYVSSIE